MAIRTLHIAKAGPQPLAVGALVGRIQRSLDLVRDVGSRGTIIFHVVSALTVVCGDPRLIVQFSHETELLE